MDNELLKYFMEESNRRMASVESKLDDLTRFKIQMIATARTTSFIVSGACGAVTLLITALMLRH